MNVAQGQGSCPICKKEIKANANAADVPVELRSVPPFCSARCKQIDLNKWLAEDYRVPTNQKSADEEEIEGTGEDYEA